MKNAAKVAIVVAVVFVSGPLFAELQAFPGSGLPGYALENGDVNGDWDRDVSDPIYLLNHLFVGGSQPVPLASCGADAPVIENGDSNGDGAIDLSDGVSLIVWLYTGGPEPVNACNLADGGGAARNPNPRIVPVHAKPHGMTYGDWGLAWWKWALELPREGHPIWDETGADCGAGQSGSVWFLGGTFGGPATRTECTVPTGKTIFLPLLNWSAWTPEDLDWATSIGVPGDTDTEILQNLLSELVDQTYDLECSIDGVPIQNLESYRNASTGGTSVTISDVLEEAAGYAPGPRDILVADGHYLMIAPLPKGPHTIEFSSKMDCAGDDECFGEIFAFDVGPIVYEFTVK